MTAVFGCKYLSADKDVAVKLFKLLERKIKVAKCFPNMSFHEAFSELFHSLKCLHIILERSWIINCSNPFQTIRWRRQSSLAVRLMVRVHLRGGVRINSPPRRHRADCRLDHPRKRRLQSRGQESVVQLPSDPDDWRLHHALRLLWVTCMRSYVRCRRLIEIQFSHSPAALPHLSLLLAPGCQVVSRIFPRLLYSVHRDRLFGCLRVEEQRGGQGQSAHRRSPGSLLLITFLARLHHQRAVRFPIRIRIL